ncbi:MAG TPA: aldo/keto reductase [Candidatus Merdisoma merdipullorum]|nr:aldo/keto reductase [Candidatus Merdisoma merdipullorum]
MEYAVLNNGIKMPMEGIGTFLLKSAEAEESVYQALKAGYRLVDTANAYMNEKGVGRGIKKSGVKREDIFLVTKLWPTEYEDGERAIEDTLKRLGTDYVDLLILHQPVGNYLAGYQAMEEAYRAGKVKALGLSNFPEKLIQDVIDHCEIKPQMVQVEAHPYYPQTELKQYLSKYQMVLMAWYPLGHGDKSLVNEEVFTELAKKYGKTNAQIVLRWHVQEGNVIIPGSKNAAHIRDNFDIFDFSLTEDEMARIAKVDKNTRYYNMSLEDAAKAYLSSQIDFNAQE